MGRSAVSVDEVAHEELILAPVASHLENLLDFGDFGSLRTFFSDLLLENSSATAAEARLREHFRKQRQRRGIYVSPPAR